MTQKTYVVEILKELLVVTEKFIGVLKTYLIHFLIFSLSFFTIKVDVEKVNFYIFISPFVD